MLIDFPKPGQPNQVDSPKSGQPRYVDSPKSEWRHRPVDCLSGQLEQPYQHLIRLTLFTPV